MRIASATKTRATEPHVAAKCAEENVDDGVADVGDFTVDEQGHSDRDDDRAPGDAGRPGSGDDGSNDQSHNSWAYALEDAGERGIALDGVGSEEHGDGQDDAERREDCAQCGDNTASQTTQAVANDRGDVDGKDAGHGLCNGQQVEKLLGRQPSVLIDNLALNDTDHSPSTPKGEQTYLEECDEKIEIQF